MNCLKFMCVLLNLGLLGTDSIKFYVSIKLISDLKMVPGMQ